MRERLNAIVQAIREDFPMDGLRRAGAATVGALTSARVLIVGTLVVSAVGYTLVKHPPLQSVPRGDVGVRGNLITGRVDTFRDGSVVVLPGLHQFRRFPLGDQTYRPASSARANGEAPFQSVEGLSLGVDLTVRYALDPARVSTLPDNPATTLVEPSVQGVIYKIFARYTVREIFSSKRAEILQAIEKELAPKLAADGVLLRSVQMGKVDLPADYAKGMEKLLAEELESEKMRYTLELKEKRVKETELEAEAERVRREKAALAAGNEQIIAARAQEEAMKHVLPFKQKQIEQRQLEAEAEKLARIKGAEGNAQARRIEAAGEADSRQKLADAEAYRLERVGQIASAQMERDGALISKHPLLIQKTLADKLSDKISVIIAPPGTGGDFVGASLLGGAGAGSAPMRAARAGSAQPADDKEGE